MRTVAYVGRGGKHQCIYWDAALECFGVRVYPSGRRTYVYSYRIECRKRSGKLGRVDTLTLDLPKADGSNVWLTLAMLRMPASRFSTCKRHRPE